MQALGDMKVDTLPSEIFGIDACSINQVSIMQPLKTSVLFVNGMTMDTWPERRALVVVTTHSCREFSQKDIISGIKEFFPGARIMKKDFLDHSRRCRRKR
jgi:hypothetical protein